MLCVQRWEKSVEKKRSQMLSIELLRDVRFLVGPLARETRLRPKKMRAF
jgi:hypothetical protein